MVTDGDFIYACMWETSDNSMESFLVRIDPTAGTCEKMFSMDSTWIKGRMLGLGSKQHNTDLIMQDEENRPAFSGKVQIKLWKPWERLEEQPPAGVRTARVVQREPGAMFHKGKEENP